MKRKLLYSLFIGSGLAIAYTATTKIAGPPPYSTGAPNELTCAQSTCHDGVTEAVNSGSGSCDVEFDGGNDFYDNNKTYQVKIKVSHSAFVKYGFQVVALFKSDRKPAGTVTITDTIRTQLRDKKNVSWGCCPSREWVGHKAAGITAANSGSLGWTYNWRAPATGNGEVVFYLAALAGNNDATDTLDYTYTTTKTITYKMGTNTGVDEPLAEKFQAFCLAGQRYISWQGLPEKVSVSVYNINGKQLNQTCNTQGVSVNKEGVYLLVFKNEGEVYCQKLFVY
ncbi:MAG: T9SS type A sorting domain-containing protein [Flavobacteriaceae bacterium]|nr:T9SS type A sorting domain-containing protein [Flavobacteriaceae bacterium]